MVRETKETTDIIIQNCQNLDIRYITNLGQWNGNISAGEKKKQETLLKSYTPIE